MNHAESVHRSSHSTPMHTRVGTPREKDRAASKWTMASARRPWDRNSRPWILSKLTIPREAWYRKPLLAPYIGGGPQHLATLRIAASPRLALHILATRGVGEGNERTASAAVSMAARLSTAPVMRAVIEIARAGAHILKSAREVLSSSIPRDARGRLVPEYGPPSHSP